LLTGLPVVSLEDFELLVGLGQAELDALTDVATVELFGAGEVVFRAGDPGDRMYFIRSGVVSVVLDVAGKTRRLATMGPGATFGEMAIIDGERRSATIAVDEDATCLVLPTKDLEALNDEFPKLGATLYRNLTRSLSRRLREAHEEIRALAR
jgi:CRP-like cAMP-binding protein